MPCHEKCIKCGRCKKRKCSEAKQSVQKDGSRASTGNTSVPSGSKAPVCSVCKCYLVYSNTEQQTVHVGKSDKKRKCSETKQSVQKNESSASAGNTSVSSGSKVPMCSVCKGELVYSNTEQQMVHLAKSDET
jgi:hypothetical protein